MDEGCGKLLLKFYKRYGRWSAYCDLLIANDTKHFSQENAKLVETAECSLLAV